MAQAASSQLSVTIASGFHVETDFLEILPRIHLTSILITAATKFSEIL